MGKADVILHSWQRSWQKARRSDESRRWESFQGHVDVDPQTLARNLFSVWAYFTASPAGRAADDGDQNVAFLEDILSIPIPMNILVPGWLAAWERVRANSGYDETAGDALHGKFGERIVARDDDFWRSLRCLGPAAAVRDSFLSLSGDTLFTYYYKYSDFNLQPRSRQRPVESGRAGRTGLGFPA